MMYERTINRPDFLNDAFCFVQLLEFFAELLHANFHNLYIIKINRSASSLFVCSVVHGRCRSWVKVTWTKKEEEKKTRNSNELMALLRFISKWRMKSKLAVSKILIPMKSACAISLKNPTIFRKYDVNVVYDYEQCALRELAWQFFYFFLHLNRNKIKTTSIEYR